MHIAILIILKDLWLASDTGISGKDVSERCWLDLPYLQALVQTLEFGDVLLGEAAKLFIQ